MRAYIHAAILARGAIRHWVARPGRIHLTGHDRIRAIEHPHEYQSQKSQDCQLGSKFEYSMVEVGESLTIHIDLYYTSVRLKFPQLSLFLTAVFQDLRWYLGNKLSYGNFLEHGYT